MKKTIFFLAMLIQIRIYSQQIGGNGPISVSSDACTSGCITLPAKISIANAMADGSTKGAASFNNLDFDATSGNISIDYANAQPASATQNGFVNQSGQTFAGLKTFNSGLSISTGQLLYFGTNRYMHTTGGEPGESFFAGVDAGSTVAGGHGNVGIGYSALTALTSDEEGNHNTAVGFESLFALTTAYRNTMVGSGAGRSLTDFVTGEGSGSNENTGVGFQVLMDAAGAYQNTAMGALAGNHLSTGNRNTFIGYEAGANAEASSFNTLIGFQSGTLIQTSGSNSGDNNTFLGYLAGATTETGDYNILIGDNVNTTSATSNNQINIGNTIYGNRTVDNVGIGINNPTATLHLKSGTASANTAPIKIESGTVNTTVEAGTIEYDGNTFYASPNETTGRGISPSVLFNTNASDVSLLSSTSAQSIFPAASDQITLAANTTYFVQVEFTITGMGSTSRTISFICGGTAGYSSIGYTAQTWSGTASAIATNQTSVRINSTGASLINATNASAETTIIMTGMIRTTSAGTCIPQIQFSSAPTGSILCTRNSFIMLTPLGNKDVQSTGNWN